MALKALTSVLDGTAAIRAVGNTLRCFDARLVDHGERVAFITSVMLDEGKLPLESKLLFMLSLFHDIGAYKTEEIDHMVEFETGDVWNHSIYGYLFLKYMTPLEDAAEAILYHHMSYLDFDESDTAYKEYAALLYIADRADIALAQEDCSEYLRQLFENEDGRFSKEHVEILKHCVETQRLRERLEDGSYKEDNGRRLELFRISPEEVLKYVEMLVYSIDFRSEYTVTHTINTIALSLNIADHFGLSELDSERLFLAALLHDVGKVAIPAEIIEGTGSLTEEQRKIMQEHVEAGVRLIEGVVPAEICNLVRCHHEKLDGSGYPSGLTAEQLGFPERVLAFADVVSALASKRSYKEPFHREKAMNILREMSGRQLDQSICDYICSEYEFIIRDTSHMRNEVIRRYQAMTEEHEILNQIFAG